MTRFSGALKRVCSLGPLLFLVSLALLSALPISFAGIPLEIQKGIFSAGASALLLILTAISLVLYPSLIQLPRTILFVVVVPLLIAASISAFFSERLLWGLFGTGFAFGTWGSFVLFAVAVGAGSLIERRAHSVFLRIYIDATALCILGMTALFLFFGKELLVVLGDTWPIFSFGIAGALLVHATSADARAPASRVLSVAILSVLLFGFFLFFHIAAALSLLVGGGMFILLRYVFGGVGGKSIQWHSIGVLFAVVILCVLGVRDPVPTFSPDIRLTRQATERVVASHYVEGHKEALFGAGPGEFMKVWERHRTIAFNASPIADETFSAGHNTILTLLAEVGFLGVLAFFFPLYVVYARLVQMRTNRRVMQTDEDALDMALISICVFVYASAWFYEIPLALFLISGALLGMLIRQSVVGDVVVPTFSLGVRVVVGLLMICSALFLLRVSIQQGGSVRAYTSGTEAFSVGMYASSVESFEKALRVWPAPLYYRDASRALLSHALEDSDSNAPLSDMQKQEIGRAVTYASTAVMYDPHEYWSWISRGGLLTSLVIRGFVEEENDARESLMQAEALSPSRPESAYLLAVLSYRQGHVQEALSHVERALALNPTYADALALKRTLDAVR